MSALVSEKWVMVKLLRWHVNDMLSGKRSEEEDRRPPSCEGSSRSLLRLEQVALSVLSRSVHSPTSAHLLAACFHDSLAIHPEDGASPHAWPLILVAPIKAEETGDSTVIVNFVFLLPVSAVKG